MSRSNFNSRDFDIPEIQDMKSYNTKAAKQRASLRWLVSIAYDHKPPDDVRDPFYVSGDEQENIKPSVVHALANAELYCLALAHIYADPNYSQLNHWGVIQALARKGVYVAEPSDVALTETTLIQSSPLRMSAHMAVTEAIMTLYIKEVVTGDRIANAVRRLRDVSKSSIGGQSAHDVEEALVIWINQSCSALTQMIADSKVAEGRVEFPGPVELADLSDGIGICALIACYCPDAFDWSQIAVNEPISVADSLNNLQLMQRFCRESLPYDVCHLTLEDMLYMHGSVKQNVIAFLADLFYLFEVRPAKCVKVPGMAVEKSHEGLRNAGGLRRQGSLQEKDKSNRMSLKEASTVTPGTKVATTQPIARRFQQSSISIELPAKPEEPRSSNRQSDSFTHQQQRQLEPEPAEEFVVHKGRNVPTLNAVSRASKQQHIVFSSSDDDRNNYHAPMAGMPSNWDDRRSSGAGRRSRRNSITEVESHLTIENFGGSQENLSMFARNPDKEQAVHTGRRQMEFETNLSSRSASINYGSGSSSRASDFPEFQATPGSVTRSSSRLQDADSRGAPPSRLSQRSDEIDDRYRFQDPNRGRESRFYDELEYVERPRRPESRGQFQQREPEPEYVERPRRPESRGQYQPRDAEFEERPRRSESRGPSYGRHEEQRDFEERPRRPESRGAGNHFEDYVDRSRRSESRGPYGGRDEQRDYEDRSRRVSNYQRDDDYEDRPKRPESRGMYVNRQEGQRDFRDMSEPQRLRDEPREPQPIVIIADPQSMGSNPVDAVAKLSKATNFAELSKLRDNLGNQGLSIVYMQNDTENTQKREKRVSVEKERPKSLFVTSQGIDGDGDDGPPQAELLSVRLKMEEKRRLIEAEKKKAEVLASKQRQTVGKAAFLQAVSKGRSERGSPDSGGGESMADVEYRSTMVSDGTDRLRSMEEMEERDHRWLQDVARSRSCVQTPDYVPDVYNEQFYLHQQAQRRTWGQPQPIPVGYGYAPMENQPMGYGQPSPVRRAQWGQPQPVRPMVMQHQYYQQPQPAFSVSQPSIYDSPQQELFPVYQAQSRQSMNAPFRLHDDMERPQSIANGPRENKNSINHDVNRSAFTLPRQGDDSGSRFLPIRRSEERESPVLMRSRHSSTQDVRKERPASATSQGSGGHSMGIHTQLPAPSVDDMEPQSISFIEMPTTTDDVDSEVPQRIQRLNLSSGSRTYRVSDSGKSPPRPSLSRSFFQAQQSSHKEPTSPRETPERDLEEELANEVKLAKLKEGVDADQGFMITFDDSPKPRRPKPQLGARKNSSTTSTTTTTKSSTPETLASPITPQKAEPVTPKRQSLSSLIRLKSDVHERSPSPTSSPSLNREVQQITESFQTQVSIPNGSGESRLSGQNGLGFVIDAKEETVDTSTLDDMEKKKEMLLLKSMKRKQEIEEAKRQKELEAQIKKEEEAAKEEEKARKREEEKARRAAIFEQYKLKKAIEEAEKEGRTIEMPEPVAARQTVKLRSKPTPAKPRPKTIHVDNSDLGSKSRPGSTTHLTEPGHTVKRSEGSKGSNSSLSGSSAARRGSNSSLHADSLPREMGRRIEVHSGRKQSATLGASNNNENDYDGNTTARTPVKRAPSPGMGNTMRTRTIQSPSGPGSLPHGLVKQRSNLMDDNASDAGSTASSEYIGPRLFKQPTAKSNRSIILNAVEYCIFPGAVNRQSKQQVLEEIARSEAKHFLVLFRDAGSQFRALYEYFPESEEVIKVWGNGPKQVTGNMFEKFFKYNSGGKCFSQVHTKTLTVTIDAFTIHSSLWSGKKTPLPNRKDMSMVI